MTRHLNLKVLSTLSTLGDFTLPNKIDKVHPYVCILYQTRNSKHHVDFYVANLQEQALRGTVHMVADGPLVALSLPRPAGDAGISLIVDNGDREEGSCEKPKATKV